MKNRIAWKVIYNEGEVIFYHNLQRIEIWREDYNFNLASLPVYVKVKNQEAQNKVNVKENLNAKLFYYWKNVEGHQKTSIGKTPNEAELWDS